MKSQKLKVKMQKHKLEFKIKNIFYFLLVFLTFEFCFLNLPKKVFADFSLAIDPPIFQVDATPPTSIRAALTIQNNGSEPVSLFISLKPFKSSDLKNGTIEFLPDNQQIPGNDPLILEKIEILDTNGNEQPIKNLILGPTEEKKMTLHIVIPKDEPSGDYYFSIVFNSNPDMQNTPNASTITGAIASNVLLSIGPKTRTTGSIANFSTPFFIFQGPVDFRLLVENASKHFIIPKGEVVIKNTFGQNIGQLALLPVNVLSQSNRYMITDSSSPDGRIIWAEKILFGLYSAHLRISLSDEGPFFDRTIYFFALPAQVILGIVLASIIVAMIGLRVKERLRK